MPTGSEVDPSILVDIPLDKPLRLFSVSKDAWSEAFKPPLELPSPSSYAKWQRYLVNDRYSDLLLPDPDGERAPLLDNTLSLISIIMENRFLALLVIQSTNV